jgi:hypothetical protein
LTRPIHPHPLHAQPNTAHQPLSFLSLYGKRDPPVSQMPLCPFLLPRVRTAARAARVLPRWDGRCRDGTHTEQCAHLVPSLGCSSRGKLTLCPLYRALELQGQAAGLQPRRRHGSGTMDGCEVELPLHHVLHRPIRGHRALAASLPSRSSLFRRHWDFSPSESNNARHQRKERRRGRRREGRRRRRGEDGAAHVVDAYER